MPVLHALKLLRDIVVALALIGSPVILSKIGSLFFKFLKKVGL